MNRTWVSIAIAASLGRLAIIDIGNFDGLGACGAFSVPRIDNCAIQSQPDRIG